MVYLDNAATTFPKPEVVYEAMDKMNREGAVNAGRGSYKLAQAASKLISETKELLRKRVHVDISAAVVFSPSVTIAMNQIVNGLGLADRAVVYVSPYEHNAVVRTIYNQGIFKNFRENIDNGNSNVDEYRLGYCSEDDVNYGNHIIVMPLAEDGSIDIDRLSYEFSIHAPAFVFMTHVSNVTGYILPVEQIAVEAKGYGATVVVDGSQALGLVPFDMAHSMIDFYVFAGHKTPYGPFGIGGFFIRHGKKLDSFIAGGTGSDSLNVHMPESGTGRYEPASPNVLAAAGLLAAIKNVDNAEIERRLALEKEHMRYIADRLGSLHNVKLYLPPEDRHAGIAAFNVKGYKASDVGMILDADYDIAVRTGYHCAPLIHEYLDDKEYSGVVRASISMFTTVDEIDALVRAVGEI